MREKILNKIAVLAEQRTALLLITVFIITMIAFSLALRLKLEMHFRNLMPQDHPMVEEFNQIIDEYSTASMIIIAAKGREQDLKQFADELAVLVKKMTKYVQRIDYKLETDFFLKHGFLLQKEKDLKNSKDIFSDLNLLPWLEHLNDNFEKTYVYDEESISTKEKENNAIQFLDGIEYWLKTVSRYIKSGENMDPESAENAALRFLLGDEYLISPDKDMLLLFAQPTFSLNEINLVVEAENAIDSLIARVAGKYPGIEAGTTGTIALARDEMVAVNEDMYVTSIIAMLLIIVLFIVSFRMLVAPILAGITLIVGIIWTAGFTAITIGSLNIMTSMFSVILIGLGVDFSIHIISVYTEIRASGAAISDSLQQALLKSGNGIITGALTTALAFLTLMISKTAGMSEFGLVAGSGVIFCMLAALFVLPPMLVFRDKILIRFKKESYKAKSTEFRFLGTISEFISRKPLWGILGAVIITIFLGLASLNLTFDYNYLNMEPLGLTSIKLQHEMEAEFNVTPDFALITAMSVEEARRITTAAKDLKMIGMVTSISEYIPSPEQQAKRVPLIEEIRKNLQNNTKTENFSLKNFPKLFDQLNRLEANIIELAQLAYLGGQEKVDQKCKTIIGDLEKSDNKTIIASLIGSIKTDQDQSIKNLNLFQKHFVPKFRTLASGMTSTEPITLKNLPQNILDQFINKNRDKYLVTIYPKEAVWDLEFLQRFTDQMQKLDQRVTGMPSVFYVLTQIIGRDGKIAAMLAIAVIFILLIMDFKKPILAVLAMVPLVIGAIWMMGTMYLLGLQLTLVNVIGLPLILGIGIDDGVHLIHRYRVEGPGKIRTVFTSTGRAVLLTSLTTMLAFGSFKFATYRGLGSLGAALFIGVGACFLTSIFILPALLGLLDKQKIKD